MIDNIKVIFMILIVILVILTVAWMIITYVKATPSRRKELIDNILYALAVEVERLYGSKTGQIKKKELIALFYERHTWLARWIPSEQLSGWIDEVVDKMNNWIKSNRVGAANAGISNPTNVK